MKVSLKHIYKANQCTDLNDVDYALNSLREIARVNNMEYTPAMRKRLASLEKRKKQIEA